MINEDEIEVLETDQFVVTTRLAPPRPLTGWQKWKKTIYNSETKQIFGRTLLNWGRLGLFYLIFYGILAVIVAISTAGLLYTLDSNEPKWKLGESLIGQNPGLGFRPVLLENDALISYSLKKPSTGEKWVKLLDKFLEPYKKIHPGTRYQKCNFYKEVGCNTVCLVDTKQFGPCTTQNKYGYNSSSPCVFIKLNKIFGWIPEFYVEPQKGMPLDLIKTIKKLPRVERNQIWISCNGIDPVDKENIEGFKYYPGMGFPGYFYPYLNVKNYVSPLIAVHILNLTHNIVINVECRAWAKNIYYKGGKLDRQGSVSFEILVDGSQ